MHRASVLTLASLLACACHTYEPRPVDLQAHARQFAERLQTVRPDHDAAERSSGGDDFVLDDGIDRAEGRRLALLLHPDCRLARLRANTARIVRDSAGRWPDPELGVDLGRILETVPHAWVAAVELGFTVPLSGRLGKEHDLAAALHDRTLVDAIAVEAAVQDRTDLAWVRWSAHDQRVQLLRSFVDRLRDLEAIAARLAAAGELTQPGARTFTLERVHRQGELLLALSATTAGELELKRLLGLHPAADVRFQPSLSIPPHPAEVADRPQLLFDGPRLLQLRAGHGAAERALALAVARQWPDLVLRPGFGEEDAEPRVLLGFSLPLPLFSGNTAGIREAEAERDLAAEALRCGYEGLVQELALAESQLAAAARQRELVDRELLPLAELQVADCRRLAELGQLDPLLILDALVRDHTAKALALDARLAEAEATVTLNALFATAVPRAAAEESR